MKNRALFVASLLLVICGTNCLTAAAQSSDEMGIAHIAPEAGRERARARLVEEVTRAWEQGDERKQPLRLVVLDCDARGRAYKSEMRQLFPTGTAHLPKQLQPRAIYTIALRGSRRIQYIGHAERDGFRFVLFRFMTDADNGSGRAIKPRP